MATVTANWDTTTGDWFVGGNWLEPNPNPPPADISYVPDANTDVQVTGGGDTASAYTITYDGTDTVDSLSSDGLVTLDMTGGTLSALNGGIFDDIDVQIGAALDIAAGTLTLENASLSGTVSGAGTLQFLNGDFGINVGFTPDMAAWVLNYQTGSGTVSVTALYTDLSYAGDFRLESPYGDVPFLNLNGHEFTLSGTAYLNGNIDGTGTLLDTGTTTIVDSAIGYDATNGYAAANAATFENAATVVQEGGVELNGTIMNDAGATWTFDAAGNISSDGGGGTFVNDGTVSDTANDASSGPAEIDGAFTNNGSISIASGALFVLGDGTETLSGTISGAGTLGFGGAHDAILQTTALTVASIEVNGGNAGGTLSLGADQSYGGIFNFDDEFGALSTNGFSLTLSGVATFSTGNIYGPGSVLITGTATIGGMSLGYGPGGDTAANAATFENAGSVTQDASINLNGTILNDAGATWTITAASGIQSDGAGATFTNDGTLTDTATGGNAEIDGAFSGTGALSIDSGAELVLAGGTETVGGDVSGAGTLAFGYAHQATLDTNSLTVATIAVNGGNGGGTLSLGESLTYGGSFNFTDQFGYLDVAGDTLTLSGTSTFSGGSVYGNGTVLNTGTSTIDSTTLGASPTDGYGADDAAIFENAGSITQNGNISFNGTLLNDAGATWTMAAASYNPAQGAGGSFTNDGTLDDNGAGIAEVDANFTNSGTTAIAAGATLLVQQGTQTLDGTISGAGTLSVGGTATLDTTALTVGTLNVGGTFSLGESLTYAGNFNFESGYLGTGGDTLTLSGTSTFNGNVLGPGTVLNTGAATLGYITFGYGPSDGYTTANASTFENAGSVSETANVNLNGSILNDAGATWTITDAGFDPSEGAGSSFTNAGTLTDAATSTTEIDDIFDNTGTAAADDGTLFLRGAITNDGTLAASGGNLLLYGAVAAGPASTGLTTIAAGDSVQFGNTVAADQTVTFQAATGTLQIDDQTGFAATITGFQAGDVIDLAGVSYAAGDQATLLAGNILQITNSNQTVVADLQLDPAVSYAGQFFHLGADPATNGIDVTVNTTACYCTGTLILTDQGEVAVEALAIGHVVVTASGEHRPIKWIGWRRYSGRMLAGRRDMLPICFEAGSLADGVPRRDLWVSPKHAMVLDGVLVPAELLVNGVSVRQAGQVDTVAYYHVELDSHDVLLAEGAASESFVDDDSRGMFHNAFEYRGGPPVEAQYCAHRLEDGYALESLLRRIAGRAGLLPNVQNQPSDSSAINRHRELLGEAIQCDVARAGARCPGLPRFARDDDGALRTMLHHQDDSRH